MAICTTANFVHFCLQNAPGESSVCYQVCVSHIVEEKWILNCLTFRCIRAIMNLLSMASERVPAADDLTPVLIYVIIKVRMESFQLNWLNFWNFDSISGKSTISSVDHSVCRVFHRQEIGGRRIVLVDAVLISNSVYQNHGIQWLIVILFDRLISKLN